MNYCNFAKVMLSRCTKDTSAINWWNNPDKTNIDYPPPSFNTSLTLRTRHENYINFMRNYPKMQIDYKTMEKRITRIQSYLTNPKYWQHDNKDGQRQEFYQNFSIYNWARLAEIEKKRHQLTNCNPCNTTHLDKSYIHKSVPKENLQLKSLCEQVADKVSPRTSGNKSNAKKEGKKAVDQKLSQKEPGSIVIWSRLAKKYDLKINDRVPLNGGQVLMEFARSKGVPVFQFNKHTRISGRDFKRRVRRSIKAGSLYNTSYSSKIHSDVQTRIRTGEINIGMPVAPKTFKKDLISPDGTLTEKKQQVYGRKIKIRRHQRERD
ncbi:Hypothetical predicted protein [Mytilus galloprovincialis]|uniref:Uncharacterized protein n=1 Tax=Mytilus galloprovincialis TaxID=29158 RepID=A0A8B6E3L7_MYTGA|nr:Hypothetical predicted protein [Mytilus galloprovincialis]